MSKLLAIIKSDQIASMKAKEKIKVQTLRLIASAVKQIEIDDRVSADDALVLRVIVKMVKQRNESIRMYVDASREDLADIERTEIKIIESYLPDMLSDSEVESIVNNLNPKSMADLGKVMGFFKKPEYAGRVDMGKIASLVKSRFVSK